MSDVVPKSYLTTELTLNEHAFALAQRSRYTLHYHARRAYLFLGLTPYAMLGEQCLLTIKRF